ncbi:MAG: RNA polymerase sigma-54 factor [Acidobacteria bacterium]|jgi:RNA polymerase sigma-54 factor|nr:MAG: RNA polymerase sigma-54 factor [Acidobacteriota bacterium]GIU81043.1 MAG: RNA polymerase sigma-54 factor [Pyrinomonadaceae bacterium]
MPTLRLTQSLKQQMILTPQLRQRIEMLQMTSLELSELIQQELINNPVLEEVQPDTQEESLEDNLNNYEEAISEPLETIDYLRTESSYINGASSSPDYGYEESIEEIIEEATLPEKKDPFEEVDFDKFFQEYLDPGYKTQEIEINEDLPEFEQFLSHSQSLSEYLEWQINLCPISERQKQIAYAIIGNLDEDGRLTESTEEIIKCLDLTEDGFKTETVTPEEIEKVRKIVMTLDPIGCGSRSVEECLLVQLEQMGKANSLTARLIKNHFHDLAPNRLIHLSKQIGVDLETLKAELEFIRKLDPFPGRKFAKKNEAIYVVPEVYIEKIDDKYVIYFADDKIPHLRINSSYQRLLQDRETPKETREFIKEKVRSAIDLLRNIEHRRQTIYKVVECIVKRQKEFLDKGALYLKPMMMKDVAEETGLHPSTISRVVNGKYAHTPQGIIELRRFFTEGMLNEDGEEISTRIIKLKIKKIIEEEDPKNPIPDQDIAKMLAKEGIKISRRTVAKYREQMRIPSSRERKSFL